MRSVGHPVQLVAGSKRLRAARQAGQATVPALIHEADELSEHRAFLLAVHDNLACRPFNTVEKARILRRLQHDFRYPDAVLTKQFCPLLDLPTRADTLRAYCTLAILDDTLQAATVESALPVDVAPWVGGLDTADRQAVLPLFTGLQLGSNRAQACAAYIDEIRQRDACTAAALLERLSLPALLTDPRRSGPQKREAVQCALRQARYPQLTIHEQHYREAARRLRLPSVISLRPPPYFESRQYQVSFSFSQRQELRHAAQRLLDAGDSDAMDDLLDLQVVTGENRAALNSRPGYSRVLAATNQSDTSKPASKRARGTNRYEHRIPHEGRRRSVDPQSLYR